MTDGHGNPIKVGDIVIQDSWGYSGAILTNCGQSSEVLKLARTRALVDWTIELGTRWVSLQCLRIKGSKTAFQRMAEAAEERKAG